MKKLLAIIVTALVLTGCMTANMLEAERSYYQAAVQLQQARAAQPLFEMTPAVPDQPKEVVDEYKAKQKDREIPVPGVK